MKVSRKQTFLEFVPPSQKDEDGNSIPQAAIFVARGLKRREYMKLANLIAPDEGGQVSFTLDTAFQVVAMAMCEVRNVEVEDPGGKVGPLRLEQDESGDISFDTLDLFEPRDIFAFALFLIDNAKLDIEQVGK